MLFGCREFVQRTWKRFTATASGVGSAVSRYRVNRVNSLFSKPKSFPSRLFPIMEGG